MSDTEPMHTLTLTIFDGCIVANMVCPHDGQAFTDDDAPDCRLLADGDHVSDKCLTVEAFGYFGDDCLDVNGSPFRVEQYPIPVTYRWDGEDFYVSPAAVSVPGQEGKA